MRCRGFLLALLLTVAATAAGAHGNHVDNLFHCVPGKHARRCMAMTDGVNGHKWVKAMTPKGSSPALTIFRPVELSEEERTAACKAKGPLPDFCMVAN